MKKLLLGLTLLGAMPSFAGEITNATFNYSAKATIKFATTEVGNFHIRNFTNNEVGSFSRLSGHFLAPLPPFDRSLKVLKITIDNNFLDRTIENNCFAYVSFGNITADKQVRVNVNVYMKKSKRGDATAHQNCFQKLLKLREKNQEVTFDFNYKLEKNMNIQL